MSNPPNLTMASERRKQRRPKSAASKRPSTPPPDGTLSKRYKNFSTSIVYNKAVAGDNLHFNKNKGAIFNATRAAPNQFDHTLFVPPKEKHIRDGCNDSKRNGFKKTMKSPSSPSISPSAVIDTSCGTDEIFHFNDISRSPGSTMNRSDNAMTDCSVVLSMEDNDDSSFLVGSSSSVTTSPTDSTAATPASTTIKNNKNHNNNEYFLQPPSRLLSPKMRARFRSEPILNNYDDDGENIKETSSFHRQKRNKNNQNHQQQRRTRAKALSVLSPAEGQIEFTLYYDPDVKSLTINLVQIVEVSLKPECFIGILNVIDKDDKDERKKSITVHLIRDADHTLRLSEYADTGFLLYLSLSGGPNETVNNKLNFPSKHTNVVFGTEGAVFNERFTIQGHTLESVRDCSLCIHALCKFGRDGEPIVLGEVSVPLKRLQSSQVLPFMANLQGPCREIELEVSYRYYAYFRLFKLAFMKVR